MNQKPSICRHWFTAWEPSLHPMGRVRHCIHCAMREVETASEVRVNLAAFEPLSEYPPATLIKLA